MTKQVSEFYGTGEKMKLWNVRDIDACPLCNEIEDNQHVIKCGRTVTNNRWASSMDELEEHLLDVNTPITTNITCLKNQHLLQNCLLITLLSISLCSNVKRFFLLHHQLVCLDLDPFNMVYHSNIRSPIIIIILGIVLT